jgi:hypothetical protein
MFGLMTVKAHEENIRKIMGECEMRITEALAPGKIAGERKRLQNGEWLIWVTNEMEEEMKTRHEIKRELAIAKNTIKWQSEIIEEYRKRLAMYKEIRGR